MKIFSPKLGLVEVLAIRSFSRSLDIVKFHQEHPELSYSDIARHFGVTRQWVTDLLKRRGIRIERALRNQCPDCGKKIGRGEYCKDCFMDRHRVMLICANCSNEFTIGRAEYNSRLRAHKDPDSFYCSKECYSYMERRSNV